MKQTKEELWAVASEYYKLKSEGKNPIAQYYSHKDEWIDYVELDGPMTPHFDDGDIWRLKPETIQHRGGEYPKPCTDVDEIIEAKVAYRPSFYISSDGEVKPSCIAVSVSHNFSEYLKKGMAKSRLYYLRREDAIDRAKVIYEID